MADPVCESLMYAISEAGGIQHSQTVIVTNGPRFSTRAESRMYQGWGAHIINMTSAPEAFLVREAEMCYGIIAQVTDYDSWNTSEPAVTMKRVLEMAEVNKGRIETLLVKLLETLPDKLTCACGSHLQDAGTS